MKIAGVNLEDAGYMPEKTDMSAPMTAEGPGKKDKPQKSYPTVYVNDREMPAIKNKDLKDRCLLVAVVQVNRRNESVETVDGKDKATVTMDFKILKAGLKPMEGAEADDAEDLTDEQLESKLKS